MSETFFQRPAILPNDSLSFRSMFIHAWDLADDGPDPVMEWMKSANLNTLCMASTYHNGWLVQPTSHHQRSRMTEGSAAYFHPKEDFYKTTRIRPKIADICQKTDWFNEAAKGTERYGMHLVAWTIGCHNTRLGLAQPDLTLRNVYGDHIWHALCPSNPEVREYLKALCRDLATRYPLWGIQLESFGWMSFAHGHHHERNLVGLQPFEQELMAYCFCPHCRNNAQNAGVDAGEAAAVVKGLLEEAFREAPDRPNDHPKGITELEGNSPAIKKFNVWRRSVTTSLVREIKTQSLKATSCRLLLQSGFDPELADVANGFACVAYAKSPQDTEIICRDALKLLPAGWKGLFQCLIQLGMGIPEDQAQLQQIVQTLANAGCNGVNFYNHSESPPKMLRWVSEVMRDRPSFTK